MPRTLRDKLKLVGYAVAVIVAALALQAVIPDDFGGTRAAIPPDRARPRTDLAARPDRPTTLVFHTHKLTTG